MRKMSPLHNNLLTVGAILGTLCLLVALAGILLSAKPLVFRSGSMSPAIETGALGISFPVEAQEIRTGDIISVENAAGVRITHRVVTSAVENGAATVRLKGDANAVADPEPYVLRTADRVVLSVPLLGYGIAWLSSPAAMFVGGLFTAFLLYLAFGSARTKRHDDRNDDSDNGPDAEPATVFTARPGTERKVSRRSKRMAATSVASLALVAAGALLTGSPSQAAFLDAASASAGFTATSLQSPTMTCTNSGSYNVTLTLTHPGGPAPVYELNSTVPARTWTTGTWPAGGSVNYMVDADHSAFTFNQTTNVTFRGLSKIGLWTSQAATRVVTYTPETNILFIGLTPAKLRCA